MSDIHISPRGTAWSALRKEVFTSEEIAESDVRIKIISKRIEARNNKASVNNVPLQK